MCVQALTGVEQDKMALATRAAKLLLGCCPVWRVLACACGAVVVVVPCGRLYILPQLLLPSVLIHYSFILLTPIAGAVP